MVRHLSDPYLPETSFSYDEKEILPISKIDADFCFLLLGYPIAWYNFFKKFSLLDGKPDFLLY